MEKKVYIDDNDADLFDNPFLTLFNTKTSFLVLLGKKIPEKLSGLSVKGGEGVPPISAKGFIAK